MRRRALTWSCHMISPAILGAIIVSNRTILRFACSSIPSTSSSPAMKLQAAVVGLLALVVSCSAAAAVPECQWGPSYWCQSSATAQRCDRLSYCQDKIWLKAPEDLKCELCDLLLGKLEKYVINNSTEEEFKQLLEDACSDVGPLSGECKDLVEEYYHDLWQAIQKYTDPKAICFAAGLCTGEQSQARVSSTIECEVCKLVVGELVKVINTNTTEAEAKAEVEKICDAFGPLKGECVTLINDNFDAIWKLLINEADPSKVCAAVGLCTNATVQLLALPKALPKAAGGVECEMCELVVKAVEELIGKEAKESDVKHLVEKVCPLLGGLEAECRALIDANFDTIWQLLTSEDPATICNLLFSNCASVGRAKVSDELCDLCELAVKFLKPYVDDNSTEEQVKDAFEQLCKLLPASVSDQCTQLVDQYVPLVWNLVKQEVDDDLICKQIGLCNSTKSLGGAKVSDDLCEFCTLIVKFVQSYVDKNSTEDQVKDALDQLCSYLGSQCTNFVDQYFPLVWDLVKQEVDSGEICKQIGLCKSTKSLSRAKVSAGLCDICNLVVTFVKPYVDSNATQEEVEDALESFCNLIKPVAKDCDDLVDEYFPLVWGLVKSEFDNGKICDLIGLCNSTQKQVFAKPLPPLLRKVKTQSRAKVSAGLCDMCKLVVSFVKPYVDANATQEEVEDALESLCKLLGSIAQECDDVVKQYFPVVWTLVKSEIDNGDICKMIGLCNSTQQQVFEKPPPLLLRKVKEEVQGGVLCALCEMIMKEVDSLIGNNATVAAVEAALEKVCDILPSSLTDECDDFVKKYTDVILKLILQGVGPKAICTVLQLCTLEAMGDSECSLCELAITFLKNALSANSTQAEMEKLLNQLCELMPTAIKDECNTLVKEYLPAIVQIIDEIIGKDVDPKKLCMEIGLCSSEQRPLKLN